MPLQSIAYAQGLNATGVVGGLSIPQAHALGNGALAFGLGNPLEPQSVSQSARGVSHVLGVGLAPGLDLPSTTPVRRWSAGAGRRALQRHGAPHVRARGDAGPQWRTGLRTRFTDAQSEGANWVEPGLVRDFAPAWDVERHSLDSGRHGPGYVGRHLPRLREAWLALRPDGP